MRHTCLETHISCEGHRLCCKPSALLAVLYLIFECVVNVVRAPFDCRFEGMQWCSCLPLSSSLLEQTVLQGAGALHFVLCSCRPSVKFSVRLPSISNYLQCNLKGCYIAGLLVSLRALKQPEMQAANSTFKSSIANPARQMLAELAAKLVPKCRGVCWTP